VKRQIDPPTRARLMGYVKTGCVKHGGFSKKIASGRHDCALRKEVSRSREKQEWRKALRT
jgi:hypothetical protein